MTLHKGKRKSEVCPNMADHPPYPSVTTFQMCHDRLVCCRGTRRVLLIYPAGLFLAVSAVVLRASDDSRVCPLLECENKQDGFWLFPVLENPKYRKLRKHRVLNRVINEAVQRSPDEQQWSFQTAHKGTSLCCPGRVFFFFFFKEKSNLKTHYHCF